MTRRRRVPIAAVMAGSLVAGLAVAGSSSATTSESTVPETSVTTSDTVAESAATTPGPGAVEILPPDEPWGGATRGEWDARSFQWTVSLPEDANPGFDATGERCGWGQFGPVLFLAGNFGLGSAEGVHRTCVVAAGTAIYMQAAGIECSTLEPPPFFGRTEDELRECASAALDEVVGDFEARVNGQVVDLDAYRVSSPLFTLTFPENNVFGAEPGVAHAVSEAYSFIIAPPPPGEHEIVWSLRNAGEPVAFTITYDLVVEAPQVIEAPPTTT